MTTTRRTSQTTKTVRVPLKRGGSVPVRVRIKTTTVTRRVRMR